MRRLSSVLLALALLPLAFTTTARAQDPADPTVYMVSYIDVAQASRAADVEQLRQLAIASRKDPGVVRFEVFQRTAPPNQFVIVGIWKDQQSYDAHAASAHVKTFRQKLEPHLVAPVDERPYVGLAVGPKDGAAIPAGSFVSVSHVDVIPPKKDDGIAALKNSGRPDPQGQRQRPLRRLSAEGPAEPFHRGRGVARSQGRRRPRERSPYQRVPQGAGDRDRRDVRPALVQVAIDFEQRRLLSADRSQPRAPKRPRGDGASIAIGASVADLTFLPVLPRVLRRNVKSKATLES